jgi:hypothetical protein
MRGKRLAVVQINELRWAYRACRKVMDLAHFAGHAFPAATYALQHMVLFLLSYLETVILICGRTRPRKLGVFQKYKRK